MDDTTKVCTKCETRKPLDEFHRAKAKPLGRVARCKDCTAAYHREHYRANREAIIKRTGEYQRANREQTLQYVAKYNAANREKRRAYSERYRAEDPERTRAQQAAFRRRHPDKHRRDQHARRAFLANVEHDPAVTLEALRDRDGDFCCYCSTLVDFNAGPYAPDRATVEHVVPVSRGGTHTFDNTAIACRACNISKRNSIFLVEWVARRK